ncbi:MAG: DUF1592 domain-containing protein, partial [Acidobacteria bacterium]|nr:DUF1592 domain-containing protein [Acidobacteriota bacterium]
VGLAELKPLMEFYDEGRAKGTFDTGIQRALERMLASPLFIFRVEEDPAHIAPGTPYRISDVELASRLSFFLWSSIPDDELLKVAEQGRLRNEAVLAQQVRRMLDDQKASALVDNFAGQWLQLRNVRSVQPNSDLFPDFDDNLRQAMRRETELLFDSIVREDRPVTTLLTADYTFVNERLARHYGMPGVYGSHFQVGARKSPGPARAAATARRQHQPSAERGCTEDAQGTDGSASIQPGVRPVPPRNGSDRVRDGEL